MMKSNYPSLYIENVSKKFGKTVAVDNVSFSTHLGEIIAVLGLNGAGKSTLMNMIAGYLAPTSGKILVNNVDVGENDILTKRDIGFLSEGAPMYQDMSVELFLKYIIELKLNFDNLELDKCTIKKKCENELKRILKTAKIEDVAHQKIETLSKGYLRRVGFAQSIIGNPPVLLLDEPTDGLDPNQKEHIRGLIKEMGKDKTIVISTHLLEEAETIASRIILIHHGKILADGALKDILLQTQKQSLHEAFKALTLA